MSFLKDKVMLKLINVEPNKTIQVKKIKHCENFLAADFALLSFKLVLNVYAGAILRAEKVYRPRYEGLTSCVERSKAKQSEKSKESY